MQMRGLLCIPGVWLLELGIESQVERAYRNFGTQYQPVCFAFFCYSWCRCHCWWVVFIIWWVSSTIIATIIIITALTIIISIVIVVLAIAISILISVVTITVALCLLIYLILIIFIAITINIIMVIIIIPKIFLLTRESSGVFRVAVFRAALLASSFPRSKV